MAFITQSQTRQNVGNLKNYLSVGADFTQAAWNTVAKHEVLTITGLVRLQIVPEVVGTLAGGAGCLLSMGFETGVTGMIAATAVGTFTTGLLILNATPADSFNATSIFDKVVLSSDFGYELTVNPGTSGSLLFHCWWEPLNSTTPGTVVAASGGVL